MTAPAGPGAHRLSVPGARPQPALTPGQLATLLRVADQLLPGRPGVDPAPSAVPDIESLVNVAVRARAESADVLLETVDVLGRIDDADALDHALRRLDAEQPAAFQLLSAVVVGAYLLSPEVRDLIGYPGQGPHPAPVDQAAEELSDGILDAVIARGPIYRPAGH